LNFAGKLVQLSVSVLLSSLIYEHLLSHGYLKVGIRTSREWIPFLCYCWPWFLGGYRVGAEWERSQCCHQMAPFARWNRDQPIACKLAITFVTTTADLDVYCFSLTFEVTLAVPDDA
jgi:hypothetical protein